MTGTRKIFLQLSTREAPIGLGAYITPESFHVGLHKLGITLNEAESEQLFDELDRDKSR